MASRRGETLSQPLSAQQTKAKSASRNNWLRGKASKP